MYTFRNKQFWKTTYRQFLCLGSVERLREGGLKKKSILKIFLVAMIRPAQIILHSFPYPTLNHPSPSLCDAVT